MKLKGSRKEEMKTKKGGKGTIRRSEMVKTGKKLWNGETKSKKNIRVQKRRKIQRINVKGRENNTQFERKTEKYPTKTVVKMA